MNLELKNKILNIQQHKNDLLFGKLKKQEEQLKVDKVEGLDAEDQQPAEYIEGMIDQKDENLLKLLKQSQVEPNSVSQDDLYPTDENGKSYK